MGRLFLVTLEGNEIYSCIHCSTHLCYAVDILSRAYHCNNGEAYLFNNIVNITCGEREDRMMASGMYTVVDVFCVSCNSILGWKYEVAHQVSHKIKEGKFVIERCKIFGPYRRTINP